MPPKTVKQIAGRYNLRKKGEGSSDPPEVSSSRTPAVCTQESQEETLTQAHEETCSHEDARSLGSHEVAHGSESLEANVERQRLLGKQIQTRLLKDVLDEFIIKRSVELPLVPLCRLVANEAIRTVATQEICLVESFDQHGYIPDLGNPFLVSLTRPGSSSTMQVTSDNIQEWDPIWRALSDAFDSELPPEWQDLKGKKYLVWDGNHRLNAWYSRIREAYSTMASWHIRVKCRFLKVEKGQEGELLLALQSTNELGRAHVQPSFKDEVFLFRKLGEADKSSLIDVLPPDDKKWVEMEIALERRGTSSVWYNVPASILGQLVWKEEFSRAITKAELSLDRNSATYEQERTKAIRQLESNLKEKAYKLAAVANPANGHAFHQLIYNYDWNKRGALSKEKVYIIASSALTAERKRDILRYAMNVNSNDPIAKEKLGDNSKCRTFIKKEVYWQSMLVQSRALIAELQGHNINLPEGFEIFYEEQKQLHLLSAFPDLIHDIKMTGEMDKQPEIIETTKRLIYRWVSRLVQRKEYPKLPKHIRVWRTIEKEGSMYPKRWLGRPISIWEFNNCPWWLDYPFGKHHRCEEQLFRDLKAGKLALEEESTDEEEHEFSEFDVVSEQPVRVPGDSSGTGKRPLELGHGPETEEATRTKKKIDFPVKDKGKAKDTSNRKVEEFCTYSCVLHIDVQGLSQKPELIDEFLKKVDAKNVSVTNAKTNLAAHAIFADFPTGFPVELVNSNGCPEWNNFNLDLCYSVASIASKYIAHQGWLLTLCAADNFPHVYVPVCKSGFTLFRTYTLMISNGYIYSEGELLQSLILSAFHRRSCSKPYINRRRGESVSKSLFNRCSNTIVEAASKTKPELTLVDGQHVRGGAERTQLFHRWLLETFTRRYNTVIDLFAGCGGMAKESLQLTRHCLSIDSDKYVYEKCLVNLKFEPLQSATKKPVLTPLAEGEEEEHEEESSEEETEDA